MFHKYTSPSDKESRLLWMKNFDDFRGKITESSGDLSEGREEESRTQEEEDARIAEVASLMEHSVHGYQEDLQTFPPELRARFDDELHQYFVSSIEAFDRNGTEGLSLEEYNEYKAHLQERIATSMEQMSAAIGGAQEQKEEKEQELEEETAQIEEDMRLLAEIEKEITAFELQEIPDLTLDEEALQNANNPQAIEAEIQKYQEQFQEIQESKSVALELSGNIFAYREKAEESLKGDLAINGVGLTASIAAGAAIGTAVPVPFIGTITGGITGAIIYGIGAGVAALANKDANESRVKKFNDVMNDGKAEYEDASVMITGAIEDFSEDGDILSSTPEEYRANVQSAIDGRQESLDTGAETLQQQLRNKEQEQLLILQRREEMEQQKRDLLKRQNTLLESREQAEEAGEGYADTAGKLKDNSPRIDEAIATIRERLQNPNVPEEEKQKLRQRLEDFYGQRSQGQAGIEQLQNAQSRTSTAVDAIDEQTLATEEATTLVSDQILLLEHTSALLSTSISEMMLIEESLERERQQLAESSEGLVESTDIIDGTISDLVFADEMENVTAVMQLNMQEDALAEIPPIEEPGFFAGLSAGFEGIGAAATFVLSDGLSAALDYVSNSVKDLVKDIPVVREIVGISMMPVDIVSGVADGAGELINGVATMIAHPIDTATGLSALVGLHPEISAGEAWTNMGKALIAYEEFADGNVGKGVGKVALNVLLTATGGGAAASGVRAGATVFRNGASLTNAVGTALKASRLAFKANLKQLPAAIGRGAGRLLTSPYRLARGLKIGKAGRAVESLRGMMDEMAHLTDKAQSMRPQGLPSALKTSDDIGNLLKNGGEELTRYLGSTDDTSAMASKIHELTQYKKVLKARESVMRAMYSQELFLQAFQGADDAARLENAAKALGLDTIPPHQQKAIIDAHNVGVGELGLNGQPAGIGNYTKSQLARKIRILDEAGITRAQRRILVEKGIVGYDVAGAASTAADNAIGAARWLEDTAVPYMWRNRGGLDPRRIPEWWRNRTPTGIGGRIADRARAFARNPISQTIEGVRGTVRVGADIARRPQVYGRAAWIQTQRGMLRARQAVPPQVRSFYRRNVIARNRLRRIRNRQAALAAEGPGRYVSPQIAELRDAYNALRANLPMRYARVGTTPSAVGKAIRHVERSIKGSLVRRRQDHLRQVSQQLREMHAIAKRLTKTRESILKTYKSGNPRNFRRLTLSNGNRVPVKFVRQHEGIVIYQNLQTGKYIRMRPETLLGRSGRTFTVNGRPGFSYVGARTGRIFGQRKFAFRNADGVEVRVAPKHMKARVAVDTRVSRGASTTKAAPKRAAQPRQTSSQKTAPKRRTQTQTQPRQQQTQPTQRTQPARQEAPNNTTSSVDELDDAGAATPRQTASATDELDEVAAAARMEEAIPPLRANDFEFGGTFTFQRDGRTFLAEVQHVHSRGDYAMLRVLDGDGAFIEKTGLFKFDKQVFSIKGTEYTLTKYQPPKFSTGDRVLCPNYKGSEGVGTIHRVNTDGTYQVVLENGRIFENFNPKGMLPG